VRPLWKTCFNVDEASAIKTSVDVGLDQTLKHLVFIHIPTFHPVMSDPLRGSVVTQMFVWGHFLRLVCSDMVWALGRRKRQDTG